MRKHAAYLPVTLLLAAALLAGIFTVHDYGESWDEADIYRYADYSLGAYRFLFQPEKLAPFETNLNLYGPGYYMVVDLAARLITQLVPVWSQIDAWHFLYFVAFLACGLAIYLLSRRWMTSAAAIGATVLFFSQPLLWGHAFINPKDIPFMSLFTASILSGAVATDRYAARNKLDLSIVPASILLGAAASFRVIGALAGAIVLAYAAYRLKKRVWVIALPYMAVAVVTAYLTWPYLWASPITHYLESWRTMSQFPFATLVLFGGQLYKADELPRSYFPTLLTLQLSEPALLLVGIGIITSAVLWLKDKNWQPAALFAAWFVLPVVVIVAAGSPLYDNGRQLYFVLPPLFVLAGLALDKLFTYAGRPAVQASIIMLAAVPGLVAAVLLHPYEYVYYNALAGGTAGAFRKFEMDYWGTSMKELSEYMNATVPPNARVLVYGPEQIVARYARPDIRVFIPSEKSTTHYDYVMLLTRENLDERRCRKAEPVDEVARRGAVFAVMRSIPSGVECQ